MTPFSEVLLAGFLRNKVLVDLIRNHFDKAVRKAKNIAASHEARYLPG